MKIRQHYAVIHNRNQHVWNLIVEVLSARNFRWCGGDSLSKDEPRNDAIFIPVEAKTGSVLTHSEAQYAKNKSPYDNSPHTVITLDQFVELYSKPLQIELVLNSEYTAIIEKDTVRVGCQVFPISKIQEILEKHKELIS